MTGQAPFQNAVAAFGGTAPADMANAFGSYQQLVGAMPPVTTPPVPAFPTASMTPTGTANSTVDQIISEILGSMAPQGKELAYALQGIHDASTLGVPLESVMQTAQTAARQKPQEAMMTVNQAIVNLLSEVLKKLSSGLADISKGHP